MDKLNDHIIERVKKSLLGIDKDAQIVLFGSRARGEAKSDSDWDFLFLTSHEINMPFREKIVENMLPIELDENIAIQVVPKNKIEWETKYCITPLYHNIQKEGIMV